MTLVDADSAENGITPSVRMITHVHLCVQLPFNDIVKGQPHLLAHDCLAVSAVWIVVRF